MVLNSFNWMDDTTTGLLSQSTQLPLPKFHHNEQTQQILSSQLSSLFKTQIPIETSPADNHRSGIHCSGSSTPKKSSISSSNPLNEFLKPHSILSQNNSSESDDDDEQINLYPLSNQVGGHTRLLLLNDKSKKPSKTS